ncbi:accessory Sec system S-layer assembly protein [Bacillaceae bacterium W0354]
MNPFKKRNKNQTVDGKDTSVDADNLLDDIDETNQDEDVYPELSIHPQWKMDEEDVYVYRFQNNGLKPLKPNQLSLAGFELNIEEGNIKVGAFVRHSLDKTIRLEETTIVLLDHDGKKLARKPFNLGELDELPPRTSRPWMFIFGEKDLLVSLDQIPKKDFQLAFELSKKQEKHRLDLEESWKKSLASEDISKLEELTNRIEPPKPGEVNFMGLEAKFIKDDALQVTLLVRNGSEKEIKLEQIPLIVEDKDGDVIAKGGFKLEDFKVLPNTSKPWNFIFPKELILKENADLSRWKAYPPQK